MRIDLLKLTNSQQKLEEQLVKVDEKMNEIYLNDEKTDVPDVKVSGAIYPNTMISFGKYQRKIDKDFKQVITKPVQNDIIIEHYYI